MEPDFLFTCPLLLNKLLKEFNIFIPFICWVTLNSGCKNTPKGALSLLTKDTVREPSPSIKPPNPNQNL